VPSVRKYHAARAWPVGYSGFRKPARMLAHHVVLRGQGWLRSRRSWGVLFGRLRECARGQRHGRYGCNQGRYGGNHERSHILLLLCMIPKSRLSVKIMRRRNIVPREQLGCAEQLGRANNWPRQARGLHETHRAPNLNSALLRLTERRSNRSAIENRTARSII